MSRPAITCPPDFPVYLAHRKMLENDIRRLPVVNDDGRIVGIISERDARTVLLPGEIGATASEIAPRENPAVVKDVMTRAVIVVHPEDGIRDAIRAMHDYKISGIPVVENGYCVGVITIQDLLEILVAALDRSANEVNEEIRQQRAGRPPRRESGVASGR
jgi:acetoin utilization protein AcuB